MHGQRNTVSLTAILLGNDLCGTGRHHSSEAKTGSETDQMRTDADTMRWSLFLALIPI
jgi:hypothetical protein